MVALSRQRLYTEQGWPRRLLRVSVPEAFGQSVPMGHRACETRALTSPRVRALPPPRRVCAGTRAADPDLWALLAVTPRSRLTSPASPHSPRGQALCQPGPPRA